MANVNKHHFAKKEFTVPVTPSVILSFDNSAAQQNK